MKAPRENQVDVFKRFKEIIKSKYLMFLLLAVLLPLPNGGLWAYPYPDTGQTKCYNNTEEITCPSPGQPFYGQDAQYNFHPRSYTKLDSSGNALPSSASSWTMVRDNVTGLIWENKTADDTIHDGYNTFTWCDTNSVTNGGNQGTCGTGTGDAATDTKAFINALNSANYGGYSDWRMPTIKELATLVNSNIPIPGPIIDAALFPNTKSSHYWSSTTTAYNNSIAWIVAFDYGYIGNDYKSGNYYVRAVRGGQSSSNLVDNGNGTVTDTATGLMWQKATAPGSYTWEQALNYVANLNSSNYLGYTDWRLPDRNELQSLNDSSRYIPAIDPLLAADTVSSKYWSSTTNVYIYSNDNAWYVDFYSGGFVAYNDKSDESYVRAVRAGQSWSFTDQVDVALNTVVTSNTITITGINAATPISITGGEYSVSTDGGSTWSEYSTSVPATVNLNDQVKVRQTSSISPSMTTEATLTIGGVSDTFSVTTINNTAPGTITVDPNPDSLNASWTLTGPDASMPTSGNGDVVDGNLDPGEYTVTWGGVSGWGTPDTETKTLAAGGSITFTGMYLRAPDIPSPPTSDFAGTAITINGSYFGVSQGSGYIDFNGVLGTIISWTDTQIVVTVPYGATTGCMKVVTDYGTSGCMDFTVGNPACFPPVKLSNYAYFNVVQDAYDNVNNGNAVLLQTGTFMENVLLGRNITTILQGGYNCSYDYNPGYSTIKGSLTITKGTVTVDKLIIAATPDLVAYYPFNGNANDESGNGNHGTVNGATLTSDRFGDPNKAYSFDGNAWIEILDNPSLRTDNFFTIAIWFKWNHINTSNIEFLIGKDYEDYEIHTGGLSETNGIRFIPVWPYPNTAINASNVIQPGWNQVIVVFTGSESYIYMNGLQVGEIKTGITDVGNLSTDIHNWKIGSRGNGEYKFNGSIDEIRIYNRALSASEILNLYNNY